MAVNTPSSVRARQASELSDLPRGKLGGVLFSGGLCALALGVCLVRWPSSELAFDWLQARERIALLGLRVPATFFSALVFVVVGWTLLGLASPGMRVGRMSTHQAEPTSVKSFPSGLLAWMAALLLFAYVLVLLEWTNQSLPFLELPWLALLLWACVLLWRFDRQQEVDLRWHLQGREWLFLGALIAGSLVYWLHDANSWKYSMIGDETGFFYEAVAFLERDWQHWQLLDSNGVFNDHPVFVTAVQAFFLKIFGLTALAWKGSCAALSALGIPWLYVYLRNEFGKIAGVSGSVVYVCSILVTDWAKIGKPHAFMLVPVLLALGFFSLSARRSRLYIFLAGASAGFGFLLFMLGAIAATGFLAVALLAELLRSRSRKEVLVRIGCAFLGWLVASLPILVQVDYFQHLMSKNLGGQEMTLPHMVRNSVHTAVAFLHFEAYEHFIFGHVSDVVSSFLVLVGMGLVLRRGRVREIALYACCVFVAGTLAYYHYPPITRLVLMGVPWAVFAGLGVSWISDFAPIPRLFKQGAVALLLITIFALNFAVWRNEDDRYLNNSQIVVRYAQSHSADRPVLYILTRYGNINVDNGAFAYLNANVKAVNDLDAKEHLEELLSARGPEGFVVMIVREARLSEETVQLLAESGVTVHAIEQGLAIAKTLEPYTLSPNDLQRFILDPAQEPTDPSISRAEWDQRFIESRVATHQPVPTGSRLKPGFRRTWYSGPRWESIVSTQTVSDFQLPQLGSGDNPVFSLLWQGVLVAQQAGVYRISLVSDDGSFFLMDGQVIAENLGIHAPVTQSAEVSLEPGPHGFEIGFYQLLGGMHFEMSVFLVQPGSEPIPISADAFQQSESLGDPPLYPPDAQLQQASPQ